MRKLSHLFNVSASSAKSIENCLQISSILHGNYSQLVLLVNPNEEGLFFVVEDTSSVGPVSVKANSLQVTISLLKEEMVVDKLFSLRLSHAV